MWEKTWEENVKKQKNTVYQVINVNGYADSVSASRLSANVRGHANVCFRPIADISSIDILTSWI